MAAGRLRSGWLVALVVVFGLVGALGIRGLMHARRAGSAVSGATACDVVVRVVPTGISIDGTFILPLEAIGLSPAVIPELHTELVARGEHCLVIQADKMVSFRVIKAVMTTASSAGYPDVRFKTLTP